MKTLGKIRKNTSIFHNVIHCIIWRGYPKITEVLFVGPIRVYAKLPTETTARDRR